MSLWARYVDDDDSIPFLIFLLCHLCVIFVFILCVLSPYYYRYGQVSLRSQIFHIQMLHLGGLIKQRNSLISLVQYLVFGST